jgi:hypothetical protein
MTYKSYLFMVVLSVAAFSTTAARAHDVCANCGACWCVKCMGTPPPGRPRAIPHTDERAGLPRCVSPHATPSRSPADLGYWVGGGAAHGGSAPCAGVGTWGWDDTGGLHIKRRVALRWTRGRHQGGAGAYATDGPHVTDVPTAIVGRLRRSE